MSLPTHFMAALKGASVYAALASLWIALSDGWMHWFFSDPDERLIAGFLKGLLFVAVTSLVLGATVWRLLKREAEIRDDAVASAMRETDALRYLKALCDASPAAVVIVDANGAVVGFNPEAEALTGFSSHCVKTISDLRKKVDKANEGRWLLDGLDKVLTHPHPEVITQSVESARGLRTLRISIGTLKTSQNGKHASYVLATDITEQLTADQELKASQQAYKRLFDANPHPMCVYDAETLQFIAVNTAAVHMYGYSETEFLRMKIPDLRSTDEIDRTTQHLEIVSASGHHNFQNAGIWRHVHKSGSTIDVELLSSDLPLPDRLARLVLLRDVSLALRLMQEQQKSQLQLESLTQRLLDQEQAVAHRIAQSMHDEIAQSLYVCSLLLDTAIHAARDTNRDDLLLRVRKELDVCSGAVRRVIQELRPPFLEENGVVTALEAEIRNWTKVSTMSVQLVDHTHGQRWQWQIEHTLFMVAREAIFNALQHSACETIRVELADEGDHICLTVSDDGQGIETGLQRGRPGHLGITGMRERASHAGGNLFIGSIRNGGTTVKLSVPKRHPS